MSDMQKFLKYVQDRITISEKVLNSLTDILVSTDLTTTVLNTPILKTDYMHIDETSYLYNRVAEAQDMFGGLDANGPDYPIISDFELGSFPDILHDDLSRMIKSLVSINETNELTFGTIYSTINQIKLNQTRRVLRNSVKAWSLFSLGSRWPASYGLSDNLKNNCTVSGDTNSYSFIKLNPTKDAKTHYITVDSQSISEIDKAVPAVFILLDSNDSIDGDEFQFKISYTGGNIDTCPAVMFFDSSYNSNAVPLPSISESRDSGAIKLNNSIRIDGIDYIYTKASYLPENVLSEYGLTSSDYVFVSKQDINQRILNSVGKELPNIFAQNLVRKPYLSHGILEDESLIVYSSDTLNIVSECVDRLHTTLRSYSIDKRLFLDKSNVTLNGSTLSFTSGGTCACFGRPSSLFSAYMLNDTLNTPQQYSKTLEGYPGNVLPQYAGDVIPGPDVNYDNNGLFASFSVNLNSILGNSTAVRFGHFETAIGFNLVVHNGTVVGVIDGVSSEYTPSTGSIEDNVYKYNLGSELNVKCNVSIISIGGNLYLRSIVKNSTEIYDSGYVPLMSKFDMIYAKRVLGDKYSQSLKNKFESIGIFETWSPVLTVAIFDPNPIGNPTTIVNVSDLNIVHSLYKEELEMLNERSLKSISSSSNSDEYWTYNNVEGLFKTIVLKPEDVKGFICKVDNNSLNTYPKVSAQRSTDNSFRVGLTYNAYKGRVYSQRLLEYTPNLKADSNVIIADSSEIASIDPMITSVFRNKETNNSNISLNANDVDDVKLTVTYDDHIGYTPEMAEISTGEIVDNIDGFFGWKISQFYQIMPQ